MKRGMGRPSKLTPETREIIVRGIKEGLTYEQSAKLAGVNTSTLHRWKAKGEASKSGKFCDFSHDIKRANVEARAIHLQIIANASAGGHVVQEVREVRDSNGNLTKRIITARQLPPDWKASAWILERRFPSEFGKLITPQLPDDKDPLDDWIDALTEAEDEYSEN